MKETTSTYCGECLRDFEPGAIVHFTWYENRFFCDTCKDIMNRRVTPSYLDWQPYKVKDGEEMKKRTFQQIMRRKAIYRKHAERYKAADYPEHRAKRMLAYTAVLNKAIAKAGERGAD